MGTHVGRGQHVIGSLGTDLNLWHWLLQYPVLVACPKLVNMLATIK